MGLPPLVEPKVLRRRGATTYEKWFEEGLTRVDPGEANFSSVTFQKAFTDAACKTLQILFDLSDVEITKALKDGGMGFTSKNYTNAELYQILNNSEWLQKTLFTKDGQALRPVAEGGRATGFAL